MPRVTPVLDSGGARIAPDVLVDVSADACDVMDFHRADEVIELGRALAIEALDSVS